ncbi:MAG: glycosyltransferase [Gemmatimonadaceae bacterium]|nr:glycosyltransferase [Gemmatimonadaceae bacterium]
MRVVVLTTSERYTPSVRLLAAVAAGLGRRGEIAAVACLSRGEVERAIEAEWPRLSHRAIVGSGFVRRTASVRGIVTALRPDAMLVGSEADASIAAVALGARGGVVRRLSVGESAALVREDASDNGWRQRLARSRTRYEAWGVDGLAVSWPEPIEPDALDPALHPLPIAPPHLVIVPPRTHDEHTALALRAAAQLRARHPALRVTLLGNTAELQATRLHAAALDLTNVMQIAPLDVLLHHQPLDAFATWVCAADDAGAVATLAAMQQRVPVVVPAASAFASLVDPRVSGFAADAATLPVVVSELARLLGDHEAARRMGLAAQSRARDAFGWDAFVDAAAERLARVSGTTAARITSRPSLTPA